MKDKERIKELEAKVRQKDKRIQELLDEQQKWLKEIDEIILIGKGRKTT